MRSPYEVERSVFAEITAKPTKPEDAIAARHRF
jgi:hypothetical protein